jgi:carbonic anhydrase
MKWILSAALIGWLTVSLSGCGSRIKYQDPPPTAENKQEAAAIAVLDRKAKGEVPLAEKSAETQVTQKIHWGYDETHGPAKWGSLTDEYNKCSSGTLQSPVNLKWQRPLDGGEIYLNYKAQRVEMIDNGHTVQVVFPHGSKISINDHAYYLKQLHFHAHSEHTLSGKSFPLELHFVHEDDQGNAVVFAAFYEVGQANEFIGALWKNPSLEKNKLTPVEGVLFNPIGLLPKTRTHYRYTGSLTTPPCTEGVQWLVLNTSVELSQAQLERFQQHYNANYRPTQPLNGRQVVNY